MPPPALRVCSPREARDEIAERLVEHVGADDGAHHGAALAGQVAGVVVELADGERIAAGKADEVHVVVEVGLRAGGQFLADAPATNHVRRAIAKHAGVRAGNHVVPVALPRLRVDRRVVGVEAFALVGAVSSSQRTFMKLLPFNCRSPRAK